MRSALRTAPGSAMNAIISISFQMQQECMKRGQHEKGSISPQHATHAARNPCRNPCHSPSPNSPIQTKEKATSKVANGERLSLPAVQKKHPPWARRPTLPRTSSAVLSAMGGLTAGFGMGPGDPPLRGRAHGGCSHGPSGPPGARCPGALASACARTRSA